MRVDDVAGDDWLAVAFGRRGSGRRGVRRHHGVHGRGLHSSTLQLNLSAFCVTGGAVRGCLGGVWGVAGGIRDVYSVLLCQKRLKLS